MKNRILGLTAAALLVSAIAMTGPAMAKKYSFERDIEFDAGYRSVAACVFSNQEELQELKTEAAIERRPTASPMSVVDITRKVRGRYLNIMLHQIDGDRTLMEYQGTKKLDNQTMFDDIVECVDRIARSD